MTRERRALQLHTSPLGRSFSPWAPSERGSAPSAVVRSGLLRGMAPDLPDDLVEFHRQYNRASDSCWAQFADDRALLTGLARDAGGQGLLVRRAVHCNGLDLP